MSARYEVAIRYYGRKRITSDCPAQGLLEWPRVLEARAVVQGGQFLTPKRPAR